MARLEMIKAAQEHSEAPASPQYEIYEEQQKALDMEKRKKKRVSIPEEKLEEPVEAVVARFRKARAQTTALVQIPCGLDFVEFKIRKVDLDEMVLAVHIPLGMQYTEDPEKAMEKTQEKFAEDEQFRGRFCEAMISLCSLSPKILIDKPKEPSPSEIWIGELEDKDKSYLMRAINILHGWDEETRKAVRPFRGEKRKTPGRNGSKVRKAPNRTPKIEQP